MAASRLRAFEYQDRSASWQDIPARPLVVVALVEELVQSVALGRNTVAMVARRLLLANTVGTRDYWSGE